MRHSPRPLKTGVVAFGLFAIASLGSAAEALPRKLPPIDECASDRSFTTFRAALVDIAKREDTQALIANFAPSEPRDKRPDPNQYIPTEDWAILRGVLRMGCVRDVPSA